MKKTKFLTALTLVVMLLTVFCVTAFATDNEFTSGDYKYCLLEDGTAEITAYTGSESTVNLPSKLGGKKVTSLGNEIFRGASAVKKVTVPDSVKSIAWSFYYTEIESIELGSGVKDINSNAFYCSWSLKSISVSAENKYFTSVDGILYNKAKTRLVCVPSGKVMDTFKIPSTVKVIGRMAIRDVKLKNLVIPSSVTKIEEYAITPNGVETITVPGSVEVVEQFAFYHCYGTKEIKFEAGKLKEIPDSVFSFCRDLERVVYPSNITSIGTLSECYAFKEYVVASGNKIYSSVDGNLFNKDKTRLIRYARGKTDAFYAVPETVTSVNERAFYGASNLKTVYFYDTVKEIGDYADAFSGISKIYYEGPESEYPKSEVNAYMESRITYNCQIFRSIKNFKATQTITTLTLKWDKVKGAEGYRVYKYNSATGKYEYLKSTKGTTLKLTDLKSGTEYKFRIRAYIKTDTTIYGPYSAVLETATKTKTPSITDIYSKTKGKAVVKWSNVSRETGFQLYYATSKDGEFKKVKSYEANKLAGAKYDLSSGKTYFFKVRAYKKTASGTVYSAWSSVKSVKVK